MTEPTPPGDVLGLVLGKLDGVRKQGGSWAARCPAHDDGRASLDIKRGDTQPVILHCFAECEPSAILGAIGLTLADVSTPRGEPEPGEWMPGGRRSVAVYDYTDERGKLLFQVLRSADKHFSQRRTDPAARSGWAWNLKDVRRVPYRLPKILAAARGKVAGRVVWIAEGERDVHALEAAGVVATCNPGGAGKWQASYSKYLRGIRQAIIVADKDEPGRRHAAGVAAALAGHVLAIDVVEAAEGKDAADHLAAGLGLDDFRAVLLETDTSDNPVSENAGTLTSDYDTSDGSDGVQYEMRDGPWLNGQQFPPLKYTVPGLMPAGLGIIAAPPKAGKSLLILDWLLAVASGGSALGTLRTGPARDVLYLALEDGDRRLQARCRHLLAPGEEIPERFRYILAVPPGEVLAVINDALAKHPETALIVVDTLGRIMPLPQAGETTYQRDYRVAVALKRITDERPGLTIIVIHHTRKAFSDDFIDSISGTHGLAGAADTIITLSRGRGKGDGVLRVTGRDVIEAGYAVTFHSGVWALDGDDLAEARANVSRRADAAELSGRSAEILEFARQYPAGVTAKQITDKFGKDAGQYLKRLLASDRLGKPKRGVYMVSEPSELSEPQVSGPIFTDSPMSEVSVSDTPKGSAGEAATALPAKRLKEPKSPSPEPGEPLELLDRE